YPSFPERVDHGLVDDRDPVAVRPFDLHAVPHMQHPFLDLAQLTAVHVLEQDGLPDPQRLAVQLEDMLALLVFDFVVVADGDHALVHLVPRGDAVEAPFFPSLPAKQCRPPCRFRCRPSPGHHAHGWTRQRRCASSLAGESWLVTTSPFRMIYPSLNPSAMLTVLI